MTKQEKIIIFLFSVFLIVEFFILQDLPFLWDAMSKSQRAPWIYSNTFRAVRRIVGYCYPSVTVATIPVAVVMVGTAGENNCIHDPPRNITRIHAIGHYHTEGVARAESDVGYWSG